MKTQSPLDILSGHFDQLERKEITVPGLDFPLFADPLTFEQTLSLVHANKEEAAGKQARKYGAIITATLKKDDGSLAFPVPVTDLLTKLPPTCISSIIEQLFDGIEESAEALEKQCAKKKSAS